MNDRIPLAATTNYLSVSRINTFLRCPRQYTLKYIEKVPGEFKSAPLAVGSAFHDAVRAHFDSAGARTDDELTDVFAKSFDAQLAADDVPVLFDDDETRDSLVDMSRRMLGAFKRDYPLPEEVLELERAFSLELAHPVTCEILRVPVVGSIDAVVRKNGELVVLEIKSAKRRWGPDQIEWDHQTTAYLIAARKLGYEQPKAELVVTTKTKEPVVQVERLVRHRRDEEELAELASGVLRGIDAGLDVRIRGWQCRSCAWSGSCSP